MSNKSLFSYGDIRNHPHRSGFDLSRRICFTSKAGELLPVYFKLIFPGDKFELKHQLFTRTQPVNTAAYTRIREYLDWYFVPLRLINKNLPQAIMQMQNNPVQASGIVSNKTVTTEIPWATLGVYPVGTHSYSIFNVLRLMFAGDSDLGINPVKNFFGFNAGTLASKLAMMLRLGNFIPSTYVSKTPGDYSMGLTKSDLDLRAFNSSYAVNILSFAAYQKIYADHFRITQWEKNEPYTYNFDWYSGGSIFQGISGSSNSQALKDYIAGNNLFTMRYANWPKDMFTGVMPNSQLGEVSVVEVLPESGASLSNVIMANPDTPSQTYFVRAVAPGGTNPKTLTVQTDGVVSAPAGNYDLVARNTVVASTFSILQLRMAEAVQRYREISQVADQTARDQIYAHFGVSISSALSDQCFRLGGAVNNIDISEVVNNNLTGDEQASIQGKGVGSGMGSTRLDNTNGEYGILMGIYHIVPLLDYIITGQPQEYLYTNTADLPLPEFDSIGMESIAFGRFYNTFGSSPLPSDPTKSVMGYVPRFINLKTDYDEVYGAFRSTLKSWVAPLDPKYLQQWMTSSVRPTGAPNDYTLNYGFFKVNPSVLDSIFAVKADDTMDTDQFLTSLYIDVKAVRNFDYDGMPY